MPTWSTYRIQLRGTMDFRAAAAVAGYLAELGVTHVYLSPCLEAVPGSTHGYDVIDPRRLDPALGGAAAHAELTGALRAHGLGQVLDIVPNHMAADPVNPWWWDVLENGPTSRFASFFDIDWEAGEQSSVDTVLVPILGDHYGRVLEAGELRLERRGGVVDLRYADHALPVSPRSLAELLSGAARAAGSPQLASVADGLARLSPTRVGERAAAARHARRRSLLRELERLCDTDTGVADAVDEALATTTADVDRLDALLRRQHYRLAHWRTAAEELDYRRFFNIESLVGVRCEDPTVFDETHDLVLSLVADGTVQGLRIDHVDGLRDPAAYLQRLAERSTAAYIVVEKILEPGEVLPAAWPVAGTTGYDFLARVGNLFVAQAGEAEMTSCYVSFSGATGDFDEVVAEAKAQVMHEELDAEVERVTGLLAEITERHRRHRDHTRRALRSTLMEVVRGFPVYRTYVRPGVPPDPADVRHVDHAVQAALEASPELDGELVRFVGDLALGRHRGAREAEFALRFAQLTAPVMAKGVEDTAFYRYHRLISLNEVGGDPGVFGRDLAAFHRDTAESAAQWPDAMLTLSTHDTKRSADVRARLHVLSEVPSAWRAAVGRWAELTDPYRAAAGPDRNTEYLLYQTLVGAWPISPERVVPFMIKAAREAKVETSWTDPAPEYEEVLEHFVRGTLADEGFTSEVERFLAGTDLVARGRRTSLAQTALLLTCPGVADIYQGSEIWDLSLVDPDNRRPVDFDARRRLLALLRGPAAPGPGAEADAGLPKLRLVHRLLVHRRACPDAYRSATYEPLALHGARSDEVVAFTRSSMSVVAPRLGTGSWRDTAVDLPAGTWTDVVTGAIVEGGRQRLDVLLEPFPVAVLARTP